MRRTSRGGWLSRLAAKRQKVGFGTPSSNRNTENQVKARRLRHANASPSTGPRYAGHCAARGRARILLPVVCRALCKNFHSSAGGLQWPFLGHGPTTVYVLRIFRNNRQFSVRSPCLSSKAHANDRTTDTQSRAGCVVCVCGALDQHRPPARRRPPTSRRGVRSAHVVARTHRRATFCG